MSGVKRKTMEDPDYQFVQVEKRIKLEETSTLEDETKKSAKAYDIINRNFSVELERKESEIEKIDAMLIQVQKSLHLVRYAVVANMFSGSNILGPSDQATSIHPATRQLLQGKHPTPSSIHATRTSTSSAHPTPSSTHATRNASSSATPVADINVIKTEPNVVPGYVPPKSVETRFEPRGLQYKRKRRLIIGNVSRWIECDQREDLSTHKWMLYVRGSKDEPDISDVVSKVRFIIHQSYHPNNMIDVEKPPFHLTRRGWGEFPARIQIHFKNPSDKPIDVVHFLKLDKTYTGLQTLGSETVVDAWLHQSAPTSSKPDLDSKPSLKVTKTEKPETQTENHPMTIKTEIKEEPLENGLSGKAVTAKENLSEPNLQTYIRCKDKEGGSFFLPVTVLPKNCQKKVDWNRSAVTPLMPQRQPPSELLRLSADLQVGSLLSNGFPKKQQPLASHENGHHNDQSLIESVGSLLKSSSLPAGTSLLRSKFSTPPMTPPSLSRPETPTSQNSTPKKVLHHPITWDFVLSGNPDLSPEKFERKIAMRDGNLLHKKSEYIYLLRKKLLSFKLSDFPDDETFLMKMFRYFPLSSQMSKKSPLYLMLLPYLAKTETQFKSWTLTKQKASEWLRAKTVQRILTYLKGPKRSTKELVIMFREFGFSYLSKGPKYPSSQQQPSPPKVDFSSLSTFTSFTDEPSASTLGLDDDTVVDVEQVVDAESDKEHQKEVSGIPHFDSGGDKVGRLILSDDNLDAHTFIESSVRQLGIRTEIEEIHPGVFYPLAQKMIFIACRNFCEELLRKGHVQSSRDETSSGIVQLQHIVEGIVNNKRATFLTNEGLGDKSYL